MARHPRPPKQPPSDDRESMFEGLIETQMEDEPFRLAADSVAVPVVSALAVTDSAIAAKEELKQVVRFGPVAAAEALSSGLDPAASNIVGIGLAEKYEAGFPTARLAVQVMVKRKLPRSAVSDSLVPPTIGGYPTDVIEVGEIVALPQNAIALAAGVYTNRNVPAQAGDSIGHTRVSAGTFGCLVNAGGKLCILSNNHVLANVNQAAILDPIVQPGTVDGGRDPQHRVARLLDYQHINLNGTNRIDAAIAGTAANLVARGSRAGYNIASQATRAHDGMTVRKCGRTTGHTLGRVDNLTFDISVEYVVNGFKVVAFFDNQIRIVGQNGLFSAPGDSGSIIVEHDTFRPVGLLFAGGNGVTFANPIELVISRFNITEFFG